MIKLAGTRAAVPACKRMTKRKLTRKKNWRKRWKKKWMRLSKSKSRRREVWLTTSPRMRKIWIVQVLKSEQPAKTSSSLRIV